MAARFCALCKARAKSANKPKSCSEEYTLLPFQAQPYNWEGNAAAGSIVLCSASACAWQGMGQVGTPQLPSPGEHSPSPRVSCQRTLWQTSCQIETVEVAQDVWLVPGQEESVCQDLCNKYLMQGEEKGFFVPRYKYNYSIVIVYPL